MFSICDLEGAKSIILNFSFLFLGVQTRHFVGFSFFFLVLFWFGRGKCLLRVSTVTSNQTSSNADE
jgi:hypothetical protein